MKRILVLFYLISLSASAQSWKETGPYRNFKDGLKSFLNYMNNLDVQNAQDGCLKLENGEAISDKCLSKYSKLFEDGELNINLAFGYLDTDINKYTYDIFYAYALMDQIQEPCANESMNMCGFVSGKKQFLDRLRKCRDKPYPIPRKEKSNVFYKCVKDIRGEWKRAQIKVAFSSSSIDHYQNKKGGVREIEQRISTETAEDVYFGGIEQGSEVVMYVGHSRSGGGPSFRPPRWTKDDGHVDYSAYTINRPGHRRMLETLDKAKKKPQIMTLSSCSSEKHFGANEQVAKFYEKGKSKRQIKKLKPLSGYPGMTRVTTNSASLFSNLDNSIAAILGNVLNYNCEEGWKKSISNIEKMMSDPTKPNFTVHEF